MMHTVHYSNPFSHSSLLFIYFLLLLSKPAAAAV